MATHPRDMAGGILSYFTRHRTAANLLLVVLIAVGLFSLPRMRAQFFPDIVIDSVTVSVGWQGAGAEDVDRAIVQVLEPALLAVEGVESTSARSSEGSARIRLEFEPDWDMARAADDVQAAVDAVATLPSDADDPNVRRGNWRDPVTDVVITGPVGIDQLARFGDEMIARLFAVGVTRTSIQGVVAPETVVEVTSASLVRNDVSLSEIAAAIAEEAATAPAGDVSSGAARVRTGVEKRSVEDIASVVLRSNPDGSKLTVGDVAEVRVEGIDRNAAYFVGTDPAVTISVSRSAQGDAISMQASVEEVAAAMLPTLPEGVAIDLIRTRAEVITGRLQILLQNGLLGLGLVLVLLFLFLNSRTAFWVAAGIPVSMLTAITLMYMAGLTFNMISIFALIITLGIVVDDAIVVGEHADFRARRRGEDPTTAAENAARKMFPPVFSATLTTIIAFFGLTAISGRFGEMIADIPFTVIAVLGASLVECFVILPNHMRHALVHSARDHWYDWPSRQVNKGFRVVRDGLFRPLIGWVIRLRYPVLAGALLLLASQVVLFIRGDVQFRFFDAPEQGTVTANYAMAPGATRDDTLEMMRLLQAAIDDYGDALAAEGGIDPIDYVLAQVGGSAGRGLASAEGKSAELLGAVSIELIDADARPMSSFAFVSGLQDRVPKHPMLEELSFRGGRFGPGGDALDVELTGADAEVLKAAAEDLKTAVGRYPEVSAVEDSLAYDKEELVLELTPQGQALGFTIDTLGRVLRDRLNGIEAATFPDGMRSSAIRVELPPDELTADFLDRTRMRTNAGQYVSLADIVTVTSRTGFSTVVRENGQRVVSVTGDIDESNPDRAAEIQRALETDILPTLAEEHGISYRISGLSEQQDTFLSDARLGLILTLIGIFLTLAWIFSSWTRPIVVMAIIPFGLIGAIWGHNVWGVPMSMFSIVGLIGMVGIIINDSIVLVATIDEYGRDRGVIPAIIDAVADRLRPVFLTTATTVLGLAPLLYEPSSQAQFLKPTVVTLVFGLGFGFFLVLLIVPAIVAVQEDVGKQVRALRRLLRGGHRRARGAAVALGGLAVLIAALFVATMGWVLAFGALPGGLFPGGTPILIATAVFVTGSALILVLAWLVAAVVHLVVRRRLV
ncbi:efflux RND transporter permease subunit [Maritimibacter fusiformis]|uniref:Efflux RND transporter permease subunit n=1 Tax=Maritimibacter fusiformis TaxID=2603819 RepID=A0A5D0RKP0_9RHOB|nr:efflux RND transporter permease subunit [Maritimibacter fusiformis]TYB82062.1 efflux RND transporter permease subunit [Maritimibacter fusiformis]